MKLFLLFSFSVKTPNIAGALKNVLYDHRTMNEEGHTPSVSESVSTSSVESFNEELSPKSDESQHSHAKKRRISDQTVSLPIGLCMGTANSRDQSVDSADEIAALKAALLKSEAEKESLLAKMEYEGKLKSADIEILKIAHQKAALEWKYRITQMESEMMSKSATIQKLATKLEESVAISNHNSDSLNKKLEESRAEIDRCNSNFVTPTTQMMRMKIPLENEIKSKPTRKRKSDGEINQFANETTSPNTKNSIVIEPERKHCVIPSLKVMYDELTEMLVQSFPDGILVGEITAHYERKSHVKVDPIAVFALSWNELIAKKFNSRIRIDNGKAFLTTTYIKANNLQLRSNGQRKTHEIKALEDVGIVSREEHSQEYDDEDEKMDEEMASAHPVVTFIPRDGLKVDATGSYNTFSLTLHSQDKYAVQVNCGSSYYRLLGSTFFAIPKQPKLMQVIRSDGPKGITPVRVDFVKVNEGETRSPGDIMKRTPPTFSVEYTFKAE